VRATFNTRNGIQQNATISVTAYTLNELSDTLPLGQNIGFVEGFIRGNRTQVFQTYLMDLNSTFKFNLQNIFGNLGLMIKHANPAFNPSQTMRLDDDASFDFASKSTEIDEIQELKVE
jgi:hypothetical protein